MEFRDLKQQYRRLQSDIDRAMAQVAASGAFIMGEPVNILEQQLAQYVGVKHCISCANGTDALTLALKALGIGKGDVVFVPDFTFFASAEVVAEEGATPVFVDVDPATFNIDPHSLQNAIEAVRNDLSLHPRAIIAVDLFGLPANFEALRPIAKQYGLHIIEDGAQGFGGIIKSTGSAQGRWPKGPEECVNRFTSAPAATATSPPPRSSPPNPSDATATAVPSSPTTTSGPPHCVPSGSMAKGATNTTTSASA